VNNSKNGICVSQIGCEHHSYEVLESNERREWAWPDAGRSEEIIIKPDDPNAEYQYGEEALRESWLLIPQEDKYKKWRWSESFSSFYL
jgi:hypothetical protein